MMATCIERMAGMKPKRRSNSNFQIRRVNGENSIGAQSRLSLQSRNNVRNTYSQNCESQRQLLAFCPVPLKASQSDRECVWSGSRYECGISRRSLNVIAKASIPSEPKTPVAKTDFIPPVKPKKPRIEALDSLRFFLIMYISIGHFVMFATKNPFALSFFGQINVVVGAFFVLSGYVAGYTSTELNEYKASPRVRPASSYSIQRIMGFYPLYMLAQILFLPMFAYVDVMYNGIAKTVGHFFTTATLTQAWFPAHAELWNAPTWFLSALAFSLVVLPYTLPSLAEMKKSGLKKTFLVLTGVSLLVKIAYSYDLNVWTVMEGTLRRHPNLMFWNNIRFNPFYALMEVLMGVCACRLVMLDDVENTNITSKWYTKPSTLLLAMVGTLILRAANIVCINDALTRGAVFIPLWCLFMMQIHRETVNNISVTGAQPKGLTGILKSKALVYLGSIAFPIYIFHGPIGQLFYKKAVATKVFGGVMSKVYGYSFFYVYMFVVISVSVVVSKYFLQNKSVSMKMKEISSSLCNLIE